VGHPRRGGGGKKIPKKKKKATKKLFGYHVLSWPKSHQRGDSKESRPVLESDTIQGKKSTALAYQLDVRSLRGSLGRESDEKSRQVGDHEKGGRKTVFILKKGRQRGKGDKKAEIRVEKKNLKRGDRAAGSSNL